MLQKLSKNAGAKIVVHDPSLPPLPDEYGIDMRPNTASSVAVQTVRGHLSMTSRTFSSTFKFGDKDYSYSKPRLYQTNLKPFFCSQVAGLLLKALRLKQCHGVNEQSDGICYNRL